MNIIIFTGVPGSGKTMISKHFEKLLNIDRLSKDDEKIDLFFKFGFKSAAEKKYLDKKAEHLFYQKVTDYISKKQDVILDKWLTGFTFFSNKRKDVNILCIHLIVDSTIALKRYNDRLLNGEREESLKAINIFPTVEETKYESAMLEEIMQEKVGRKMDYTNVDQHLEIDTSNIETDEKKVYSEILNFINENKK